MDDIEVICDITNEALSEVPATVLNMHNLKMLYLDRNNITSLPDHIFESLPNLTWMDLRENLLTTIPSTVGSHRCLENLLVQNNRITHLPKELSRLSTLRVLQISENPLVYPPPEIVDCGFDDIMLFLQQELLKDMKEVERPSMRSTVSTTSSSVFTADANNRTESGTIKLEVLPTVLEQNLARRILTSRQQFLNDKCRRDKVHKVTKSDSKTSVHSYFKNMSIRDRLPSQDKMDAEQVKQAWLEKLRELISDQEKILQQEKAMNALQKWRREQNITPKHNSSTKVKDLTPYDTNPAYNAYMSREDPSEEISKELQQQQPECDKTDVEAMIRDIIMQLNTARENVVNENNPEERVKNAEHELNLVVAMHKKVAQLQKSHFL